MAWRAKGKRISTFGTQNSLKISEKKKKGGKDPSRDASVMLP